MTDGSSSDIDVSETDHVVWEDDSRVVAMQNKTAAVERFQLSEFFNEINRQIVYGRLWIEEDRRPSEGLWFVRICFERRTVFVLCGLCSKLIVLSLILTSNYYNMYEDATTWGVWWWCSMMEVRTTQHADRPAAHRARLSSTKRQASEQAHSFLKSSRIISIKYRYLYLQMMKLCLSTTSERV